MTATGVANSNENSMTAASCHLLIGGAVVDQLDDLFLAPNLPSGGLGELQCESTGAGNVTDPATQ